MKTRISWLILALGLVTSHWASAQNNPAQDFNQKTNALQESKALEILEDKIAHANEHSFDEIKAAGKDYFDLHGRGKGSGFKQYSRWEWFMEGRLNEEGHLTNPRLRNFEAAQIYRESNLAAGRTAAMTGNWLAKGPTHYTFTQEGDGPGLGRLNTLCFDPINASTVYVGAPDGGLWKSTNAGSSWTPLMDGVANLGVSGIAIDPTNTQILYVLTGDGPGVFSTSWPSIHNIGVLKSTNGGTSWQSTDLEFPVPNDSRGHRLLMDPGNPQRLLVASSTGIYRTTNGGSTWPEVQAGNFRTLEYHPTNSNIVYAGSENGFWRSLNGGNTWSQVSVAVFPSNAVRSLIAVSPAAANRVLITFANSSGEYLGLFRSNNSGLTWSLVHSGTQDLFNQSPNGNGFQSIGHYAMAMAVNPNNANIVDIAALNHWRSTDGGLTFNLEATWSLDSAAQYNTDYCHGDFHFMQWRNGSEIWACNDGGVYRYTTNSSQKWQDVSAGLDICQLYRLSENNPSTQDVMIGTQDNGLFKYNGTPTFSHQMIGDVMDIVYNKQNPNIIYAEMFRGQFRRSTDGGITWTIPNPSFGDLTNFWIPPIEVDPENGDTVYTINRTGRVFWSKDAGVTFNMRNQSANAAVDLEVSPAFPNVIYAMNASRIWKSGNYGAGWPNSTTLGQVISGTGSVFSDLELDDTSPNRIWVTVQGYNATEKVFTSANGGGTWTNLSAGLPNVPVNAVVHDPGSANGIYVGTDIGVWYRDDNTNGWIAFNFGLPAVVVLDLEIDVASQKLRAGTFGRGYWESDLFSVTTCPATLALTGNVTVSTTFEAQQSITSTQMLSGLSTEVVYDAGSFIELNPGFETVAALESFETDLAGCVANKAQPISGVYDGPMPGVVIPYELPTKVEDELSLTMLPNPGHDLVSFIFNLPEDGAIGLEVYSLTGKRLLRVIDNQAYAAGEYRVRHDVSQLPNGIYLVKVKHGESERSERLMIQH